MRPRSGWRLLWLALVLSVLLPLSGCLDWSTPWRPAGKEMRVAALDIGQGDAILVISPNGYTMLVDGGNSASDATEVILPYLSDRGFDRLDVMVLTHPDADHVGGLPTVLRSIPVDIVVATGQVHTTQVYMEFLQELQRVRDEEGTQILQGVGGVEIPFDPDVQLEVLGPTREAIQGDDKNNASIVMRLTYGRISVLLTGDAEVEQEKRLLQGGMPSAQVLKVSHHGSMSGTSDAFLEAVSAEVGLISCSADNQYGHPHDEVLERLADHGVDVYRTDQRGTIEVAIDGRGYRVTTER